MTSCRYGAITNSAATPEIAADTQSVTGTEEMWAPMPRTDSAPSMQTAPVSRPRPNAVGKLPMQYSPTLPPISRACSPTLIRKTSESLRRGAVTRSECGRHQGPRATQKKPQRRHQVHGPAVRRRCRRPRTPGSQGAVSNDRCKDAIRPKRWPVTADALPAPNRLCKMSRNGAATYR